MGNTLVSVGLDVGTTTSQMIVSRLTVTNQASSFSVPRLQITERQILYRSPVHFTPLSSHDRVDGAALKKLIENEYAAAGITRGDVDTGAVIITGETSRKENAQTVLENLSELAGEFVVATAGPDLESILAARGAGAVERSGGRKLLHMDIGGGTSNLCLLEDGKILATGCLNVGGRLLKFDEHGVVTYRSGVLAGLTDLQAGEKPAPGQLEDIAKLLVYALEMAADKRPATELLGKLTTKENRKVWEIPRDVTLSFSGGVADCIANDYPDLQFGDLGPVLGRCIRESRLCEDDYFLGAETIRATVIGAGCHATQLSGSTVFHQNIRFPLKNLPVAVASNPECPEDVQKALDTLEEAGVLAIPGYVSPSYEAVRRLAAIIAAGFGTRPVMVCLEADMAKALGHSLRQRLSAEAPCLCMDGLSLTPGSYLDVGEPVGPALPVVIKTLVLGGNQ